MKKRLISLLLAFAMVVCMIPAQTLAAEATAIDNSNLTLNGNGYAVCPVCEENVKWTALSGEKTAAMWLSDGGHYYLSGDLSSSASDGAITVNTTAGNAACLHLNGHNITSSADCTITYYQSSPGALNIMGNGTVSGSGVVAASKWRAATINVNKGAILNLYGGTVTKGSSDAPVIWAWAGQVNLYDGAKIVGTSENLSTYSSAVMLQNAEASFNMYGGEISGGHNKNSGGNVNINNGAFTMYGGTISGGNAAGYHGGNVYLKAGSFTMTGGTISGGTATYYGDNIYVNTGATANISGGTVENGNVYVAASGTTTLSGAPVIEEMKLPANVTVTADGVTSGADVAVSASGVFTTAGTANLGSFRAANGTDSVMATADGALQYVSNAALSFAEGTTSAYCPVCAKTVTWTAISGTRTYSTWLSDGGHYYLSGDLSSSAGDGVIAVNTSAGSSACLHLNGHNLTSTADSVVRYYKAGALNIMGNGTVSGSGIVAASKWRAATLNVTSGGTLNLYGGTFTKGESDAPVIWVWAGAVNLHSGAKIVGTDQNLSNYSSAVLLQNADANFNMYGGTISGGHNQNSGGNVNINNGAFTMYGGTISGGNAKSYNGGNVYLKAGSFTVNGGTISGGTAAYYGSNVYVNTGSQMAINGGTITNGALYVTASGTTTLSGVANVDGLVLAAGAAIDVGALTDGAKITVNDTYTTTAENAVLQSFVDAGYFVTTLEGKIVAVDGSTLVIADAPVEEPKEPEVSGPTYILGDVLYETDFENETVGQLPAGWSAGYSEGSAENGTLTNFGWGSGGKMTAQVESYGDYGKVFHFTSGNNDAFAAMGEIPTTNYLYEAQICVDYGYGSFGLANNYYASTDKATGALFSSIYPKGDSAKYTYKGAGLSGSQPWTTSYNPSSGDIINLQILSLNGQNYIMYEGEIVAQCAARLQGQSVDHPGFYTCYGGIYVLDVKVTEVFAADVKLDAAMVNVNEDSTATVQVELGFDKAQGLYTKYAESDSSKLSFGAVVAAGGADVAASLTESTENALVIRFEDADKAENNEKIVCSTALTLFESDYETRYSIRPFVEIDGICFYGEGVTYIPAELANGAYMSAESETQKARIAEVFGGCQNFTAASAANELTFTLFSDFHYIAGMYPATISDLKTILKRADDADASFVLSAGDFTNDMAGSPELYNTYRNYVTEEGKVLPAYNIYGNHELEFGNSMETVTWTLTNDEYTDHTVVWGTADGSFDSQIGYYYFESEGFRIIGLDSEHSFNPTTQQWEHNRSGSSGAPSGNLYGGSLGPVQLAWLEDVLMDAASKDIPCIVVAHDGFSGLGWATTSPDSEAIRALYAKANDANPGTVLMSINGHIHTNHQGWNDGVFYFDTNTVRNNWWQETAVDHYTDEHTFMFEEYDDEGNLIATYEKPYNTLTMGAKTWFSADPISCTVTISEAGIVSVDGVESDWAYGIVPTAASTVSGVECEITSGTFWDCDRDGHILKPVITDTEYYVACENEQCGYESMHQSHSGMLLQLADGTVSYPADSAAAVAAQQANDGSYIKLLADGTAFELAAEQTVCIDLNGKKTTVTGSGTLQGMDSANDHYELSAGAATVADTVTVQMDVTANGKRYIAITEAGSATFHRLEMGLSAVSLRTAKAGLYYKATYACDSILASKVSSYGVVLSLNDMPGADFKTEVSDINLYTQLVPGADFGNSTVATSGAVFGIFKSENRTADENAQYGRMKIYANAYITVKVAGADVALVGDNANAGTQGGMAYSLFDVLKAIDDNWTDYADAQAQITDFYNEWADLGMSQYAEEFTNIA